tara:strand:- start:4238 stop:4846 length:609 start_codon:yes stop_codon:yes gene_type:complete
MSRNLKSPNKLERNIVRPRGHNQKNTKKQKGCSDGVCVGGPRRYYDIKPIVRTSSGKKQNNKVKRHSPTRRIKRKHNISRLKPAIAYPNMQILRRDSLIARNLQRKYDLFNTDSDFDPFPQNIPKINGVKTLKNAIGYPGVKMIRRDSSIARSLQKQMDESLARSLQRKHDLSAALELDRIINNKGHPNNDYMIARALQYGY